MPVADPLAAAEIVAASRAPTAQLLAALLPTLLLALLLGPVFCGWLCPLGLAFDLLEWTRRAVLRLFGRRAPPVPVPPPRPWARFAVLGFVLGAALAGRPLWQGVSPIVAIAHAMALGAGGAVALTGAVLLADLVRPRLFCRALCPTGALLSLLGRVARLGVKIDPALAGRFRCARCSRACPMGIRVLEAEVDAGHGVVRDPSCIRCGACVDACPAGVLGLGFDRRPRVRPRPVGPAEPASGSRL